MPLQDALDQARQAFSQITSQAGQAAVNALPGVGTGIRAMNQAFQMGGQVLQRANQQGFYNTPIAKGVENVANSVVPAAANMKNLSQTVPGFSQAFSYLHNLNDQLSQTGVPGKGAAALLSLPEGVAEGTFNIPSNIARGSANLGTQLGEGESGNQVSAQKVLGGIGDIGQGLLNASMIPGTNGARVAEPAVSGFLNKVGQGVKQGAQFGGTFGALQGLSQGQNGSLGQQLIGAAGSGLQNAAVGGVLGGGLSAIKEVPGAVRNTQQATLDNVMQSVAKYTGELKDMAGQQGRETSGQYQTKIPEARPGVAGGQIQPSLLSDRIPTFQIKGNESNQTHVVDAQQLLSIPDWQQRLIGPFNQAAQSAWKQAFQGGFINLGAEIGGKEPQNPTSGNQFEQSLQAPTPPVAASAQMPPENTPLEQPTPPAPQTPEVSPPLAGEQLPKKGEQLQTQSIPNVKTSAGSIPPQQNPFETPEGDLNKPLSTQDIKQSLVQRDAADQGIQVRASLLARQIDSVIKSPDQVSAFRDTVEHPENLQQNAQKAGIAVPKFQDLVNKFSTFTDYLHTQQTQSGSDLGKIEQYYPHIFDTSSKEYQQAVADRGDPKDSSGFFNKQRIFTDLNDAASAGVTPKNAKIGQDIGDLASANSKELSARVFTDHLQSQFPDDVSKVPVSGFVQSRIPGMQGTYFSPRLTALTKNLEPTDFGSGAKLLDQINTIGKGLKLAGGGFHYLNMAKGFTAGSLAQGQAPNFIGVARSAISPAFFDSSMQRAVDTGVVDKASQMGVDFHASEFTPEGFTGKIKQVIDNNPLTAPLFKRIIPYMQMKLVEGAPDFPNTPEGNTQRVAYGKQVNAAVGVINDAIGDSFIKNPLAKFITRQAVLAPMYQESRIQQLRTSLDVRNWDQAHNYARAQQAIGTVLTAGISEAGRRIVTGKFDPDIKSFIQNAILSPNVPTGTFKPADKYNGPIAQVAELPGGPVSDFWNAAKETAQTGFPTHFAISHLGANLSNAFQFGANQDYYGNPLSKMNDPLQKAGKLAVNQLPVPAVQALDTKGIGSRLPQGIQNTLGIKATQPLTQSAVNTLGFRVKSDPNDPNYQAQQQFFQGYDLSKKAGLNYAQGQQVQQLQKQGIDPNAYVQGIQNQQAQLKQERTAGTDPYTVRYNAIKAAVQGDPTQARQLGMTGFGLKMGIDGALKNAADAQLAGDTKTAQKIQSDMGGRQIPPKILLRAAGDRVFTLIQEAQMYSNDPQASQTIMSQLQSIKAQYPQYHLTAAQKAQLGQPPAPSQ